MAQIPVVVSIRGDAQTRIESHFERLVNEDAVQQLAREQHDMSVAQMRETNALEEEDIKARLVRDGEHEEERRESNVGM